MGRAYLWLSVLFVIISIVCVVAILRLRSLAQTTEQQASASNATPVVDELIPSDTTLVGDIRVPADGLTPNEGTTVNLFVRGMVSDANGCANLDHVAIKVYRSSVTDGNGCTLDNNDCYAATIPKAELVGCTGPGIVDATFETAIPIANYADPTDTGSPYADDTWKAEATVYDALNDSGSLDADFEVRSLGAFSLSADHLNYGTITLGATSPQQSLTFSNTGNRLVNSYVNADDDLKSNLSGFSDILSTAVHYSSTNNFTYGVSDAAIGLSPELWEFNLAHQTDDATIPTVPGYFLLKVPAFGVNGTYSNVVTFTADAPAYVPPATEIVSMSTTALPVNSSGFTLDITGTSFPVDSVGRVNGSDRATTRISSSHLSVTIPASDLTTVGEKSVTVYSLSTNSTSTPHILMVTALTTTCPTSGNNVVISANCQFDSGTYTYTGTLTVNNGVTVTANSAYSNTRVAIIADSLDVQGTISADSKGYIGKTGPGGLSGSGGGGGGYGGNGGTSNNGGTSLGGPTYGSVTQPTDMGSGGQSYYNDTSGGKGGGGIKLTVSGTATISGTVRANGGQGGNATGGGSGGSIWITAGTLAGSGTVAANGGAGNAASGGGGGGRVAVYYTTDSSTLISGNRITAYGGADSYNTGETYGGAGTIYAKAASATNGDLIVDNNNAVRTYNTTQASSVSLNVDNMTIRNGGRYIVPTGDALTVASTGSLTGGGTLRPRLTVNSGGTFNPPTTGSFTLSSLDLTNNGTVGSVTNLTLSSSTCTQGTTGNFGATLTGLTIGSGGDFVVQGLTGISLSSLTVNSGGTFTSGFLTNIPITTVTVNSGGTMTHLANSTSKAYQLDLTSNSLTLNSGAFINTNFKGFIGKNGPGGLSGSGGGGAGYGGHGGYSNNGGYSAGGPTYGSTTTPSDIGSGGQSYYNDTSGGKGGGAVKLTVTGTATINGTVSSNGGIGGNATGGGSGGSVWIIAGTFAGSGTITANGGNGNNASGGGGGGRVAVNYTADISSIISGGKISVTGGLLSGGGTSNGDPGSISTVAQ